MKKTFYPLNILHLIEYLLYTFFACVGIYMIILGFYYLLIVGKYQSLVIIVSGVVTAQLFIFALVYTLHNRIIFCDDSIIITGHLKTKKMAGYSFLTK